MSLTITQRAAEHVKQFAFNPILRIGVLPAGCTGMVYKAEMITCINDDDHVYESNGVSIIVSRQSIPYLKGTTIDFVTEGLNSRFKFNNPNSINSCGCGESFTIQEKEIGSK